MPGKFRNVLKNLKSIRDLPWRRKRLTRKQLELLSDKSYSPRKQERMPKSKSKALRLKMQLLLSVERLSLLANVRILPLLKNFLINLSLEERNSVSRKRFSL